MEEGDRRCQDRNRREIKEKLHLGEIELLTVPFEYTQVGCMYITTIIARNHNIRNNNST